jgi:hypothetical protein
MTTIPAFAPGCFGSALAYQEGHPVCSSCMFAVQCVPLHQENLARLRQTCRIAERPKQPAAQKAERPAAGMLATSKVEAFIEKMERSGVKVTEAFAKGENPFREKGPKMMSIAAQLLLKLTEHRRPLSHDMLVHAYMRAMSVNDKTAKFYAGLAMKFFNHVGAVETVDGAILLRRP